ncbi:hypothetical protein [Bifidobacterium oedipodis]|uniref:Periplasmic binding protein domain-containing protein n=1 Tax=Bifidobacterium oedipodis TaxID=2675322 RepID=A0A7Y0ES42_9BIFI|nr:hypothetical protein [Bifidobacterium sp. DSM 109957]NMM94316.1 hypothetical protein [Bifidobacterium sp. DSM 109957]
MVFARRSANVFIAIAASCAMVLSLTACATEHTTVHPNGQTTVTSDSTGAVALFTPSDGITLNQQTPLNKWAKLVPDLTDALVNAGFSKSDISHTTSTSLDKQSRAIQDYVVDQLSDKGSSDDNGVRFSPEAMTLLVAPVVETDASTRQYGDYASQTLATDEANNTDTTDEATDDSTDKSTQDSKDSKDEDAEKQTEAVERLVSSLKLAQESGMNVVLLGNSIESYQPDAFVQFSDARAIGTLQAEKIVAKLELDKASKDNPKSIEVLLPYDSDSSDDSAADSDDNTDTATPDTAIFAQEAFQGIWQVLGPYFKSGVAVSPSGTLDASSDADDWQNVAYDASEKGSTAAVLAERLENTESSDSSDGKTDSIVHVDGIIAMNDYIASEVVEELTDLGYTGSAADINPQITISGIVDNITGKKDLSREAVPDPIKSPQNDKADDNESTDSNGDASNDEEDSTVEKAKKTQWPLVTGYGAYISNMPDVVNGKQWMTGIEDRKTIAKDLAEACERLNKGDKLTGMDSVENTQVGGVDNVPTISEDLVAVSASNLKETLIDPGYITLADAGL